MKKTDKKYIDYLVEYFKQGEKKSKKIGLEFEHFVLDKNTGYSLEYKKINKIFKYLIKNYSLKPYYESNNILSLKSDDYNITIEPGAQLEISINPMCSVRKIFKIYNNFIKILNPVLEELNAKILSIGYHPIQKNASIKLIPKKRYKYMFDYFKSTGMLGKDMMKSTNTMHINMDYSDEKEFKNYFLAIQRLTPFLMLLFTNSPFYENQVSDNIFRRYLCWLNTDKGRCGFIDEAFEPDFGYEKYALRILNTPMIIALKNKKIKYVKNMTYIEYLLKNKFSYETMENQITMLFPILRAKQHIEIRVIDGLPEKFKIIPILFFKGILYNKKSLSEFLNFSSNWDFVSIRQIYFKIMQDKFKIKKFKNQNFINIIETIFDLAIKGLDNNSEKKLLKNFIDRSLKYKKTIADMELEKFKKSKNTVLSYIINNYE